MSPVFGVAPDGDVTLFAAVYVVDVDNMIANGRGGAELSAAVRTQIGFLLLKTCLEKRGLFRKQQNLLLFIGKTSLFECYIIHSRFE